MPDSKTQTRGRAIVTFGRGWHSLAAVRSLAQSGLEVISADSYALTPSALSKYSADSFVYPDPAVDPQAFLDQLEEEVRARRPAEGEPYFLLPVQQETFAIAKHRQRFEPWIDLALPDPLRIDEVRDKGRLAEIALQAGLQVPPFWRFDKPPTAEELDQVELPAFVKIPSGAGGTGIEKVDLASDLPEAFERIHREHGVLPMIQKAVPGEDICVTAVCDSGRVHSLMVYQNKHKATDSAPGSVRETISAPAAEAAARRLLGELNWHGVAQIDFLWDGESEPWLIEINPRLFGGLFQSISSGLDIPRLLFCLATGQPLPEPKPVKIGLRSETPVVGWLGILREMVASDDSKPTGAKRLKWAFQELMDQDSDHELKTRFSGLVETARDVMDPSARWRHIQKVLEENEHNIPQWLPEDDPAVAMGLLYPISIFLEHGRVDGELLHGTIPNRKS